MNTTIASPPTQKRVRIALILQARYETPCLFCGQESIRVGATEEHDNFTIRHLCERHKGFGLWASFNEAMGWT